MTETNLKTLKDLSKFTGAKDKFREQEYAKMWKDKPDVNDQFISIFDLKYLIISWIKFLRQDSRLGEGITFYWHKKFHENLDQFLKHVFNITEGDLK